MKNWLPRTGSFAYPLRSRWHTSLFLLAITLPGFWVIFVSIRVGISSTLGESTNPAELHRAVALDPKNPQFQDRLGLINLYSPGQFNPAEGLRHIRRAAELNPYKAAYRADLASACESIGDLACADTSLARSLSLSPMIPRFEWITGNYYLRTNRADVAMAHFQRLLELGPDYAPATFSVCLSAFRDPELIFDEVLSTGKDPALMLKYLDFLSNHGRIDICYRVWRKAVSHSPLFPFSLAELYLQRLLSLARYDEAFGVWQDLVRLGIVSEPSLQEDDNLVFNGSFEQVPFNAGFDWRYATTPYLSLDFSAAGAYQGARCLRLDFTVKQNENYEPVTQLVAVAAGRTYLLTAYTRSESITSDSGPRLRVVDIDCPPCLNLTTEAAVGTTPWHFVSLEFSTGAQTRFVRLSVWRPRSRTFPTEITGTFWLDAVSLRRLATVAEIQWP